MLTVDNLSKSFGKKTVLDNISVQLTHGVYGLLGPNGSGKTTFMRCVAGIYRYNGRIITPSNVGYLPQKFGAFRELTVYEVLEYFAELKGIPSNRQGKDIHDCLEDVNLWERHSDKVKTLSGGMIRRLGVAQALLGNPELILVDEPTAGLDPEERLRFYNLLSELAVERIILLSTHIASDIEATCSKAAVLSSGTVVFEGQIEKLLQPGNGKVYTTTILQNELNQFKQKYRVISIHQNGINVSCRFLSNAAQKKEWVSCQPTIEDSYMYLLSSFKQEVE